MNNTTNGNSPYMDIPQLARELGMSRSTLQKWCRDGRLPAAKIGKEYRLRRVDFDRWYESKLRQPVEV